MKIKTYTKGYMKKFLLSIFVIISFAFYVFYNRTSGEVAYVEPAPTTTILPPTPTPTPTPPKTIPIPKPPVIPPPILPKNLYADGTFTGDSVDAYYGYVQVEAKITNGKIAEVNFLDYPSDRNTSRHINSVAMPRLRSEAIAAQSYKVNIVSGATDTSMAFRESLQSALSLAMS